jgi:hypothetical protein
MELDSGEREEAAEAVLAMRVVVTGILVIYYSKILFS